MNRHSLHTAQFLAVYLILLVLGVVLELRPIPFSQSTQFLSLSQPVQEPEARRRGLRARVPLEESRRVNAGDKNSLGNSKPIQNIDDPFSNAGSSQKTHFVMLLGNAHIINSTGMYAYANGVEYTRNESTDVYTSILNKNSSSKDNNNILTRTNIEESTVKPKPKPHKLKYSKELNAFDELVDLLTASTTHCVALDSYSEGVRYRCFAHKFRQCIRKHISKKLGRRCSGYSLPGYYQVTAIKTNSHNTDTVDAGSQTETAQQFTKTKTHDGEAEDRSRMWVARTTNGQDDMMTAPFHQHVTVDAHYSFLRELRSLATSHSNSLRLDITFDLAGLNSIHKYEVVLKLLQVLRLSLSRQGYALVRSSTDGTQLLRYLHREGLQAPLHILTLWRLHR